MPRGGVGGVFPAESNRIFLIILEATDMKKSSIILASAFVLPAFIFIAAAQAEIYQYEDKKGVVVITDKKPDSKGRKITTYKNPAKAPEEPAGPDAKTEEKAKKPEPVPPQAAAAQAKSTDPDIQKKRNEEADRLEAEARKPAPYTGEKRKQQLEMLDRADKLRKGLLDPS